MADEYGQDVSAESSTAPGADGQQQSPEGAEPSAPQFGPVPYDRFREVNTRWRQAEAQLAQQGQAHQEQLNQLTSVVRTLAQRLQGDSQRQQGPRAPVDPQMREAAEALGKIMQSQPGMLTEVLKSHPELSWLLELRQYMPLIGQQLQSVGQLREMQINNVAGAGQRVIAQLAQRAQMPNDPVLLQTIEDYASALIGNDPRAAQALLRGDLRPIAAAFQRYYETMWAPVRQSASAGVAATKNQLRTLPPASRGGIPGASAPPKLGTNGDLNKFLENATNRTREIFERHGVA